MIFLENFLRDHEETLMERILHYARQSGYTAYTSTLKEAWRLSVSGLSSSLILMIKEYDGDLELTVDEDVLNSPVAAFGTKEALKHRERGISLTMFLGLFKYYRLAYLELLEQYKSEINAFQESVVFINRTFDIIEIAFCAQWAGTGQDSLLEEMQAENRNLTNEKNKFLTIFESIPNPVFLIDIDQRIESLNYAAVNILQQKSVPGGQYYRIDDIGTEDTNKDRSTNYTGQKIVDLIPWVSDDIRLLLNEGLKSKIVERDVELNRKILRFRLKISRMLDVSYKFTGIVLILEDITNLTNAINEVDTLSGFIPICSHCKKMRDDAGFWNRLEQYIESRSDALFSHSICPDCYEEHYKDLIELQKNRA